MRPSAGEHLYANIGPISDARSISSFDILCPLVDKTN